MHSPRNFSNIALFINNCKHVITQVPEVKMFSQFGSKPDDVKPLVDKPVDRVGKDWPVEECIENEEYANFGKPADSGFKKRTDISEIKESAEIEALYQVLDIIDQRIAYKESILYICKHGNLDEIINVARDILKVSFKRVSHSDQLEVRSALSMMTQQDLENYQQLRRGILDHHETPFFLDLVHVSCQLKMEEETDEAALVKGPKTIRHGENVTEKKYFKQMVDILAPYRSIYANDFLAMMGGVRYATLSGDALRRIFVKSKELNDAKRELALKKLGLLRSHRFFDKKMEAEIDQRLNLPEIMFTAYTPLDEDEAEGEQSTEKQRINAIVRIRDGFYKLTAYKQYLDDFLGWIQENLLQVKKVPRPVPARSREEEVPSPVQAEPEKPQNFPAAAVEEESASQQEELQAFNREREEALKAWQTKVEQHRIAREQDETRQKVLTAKFGKLKASNEEDNKKAAEEQLLPLQLKQLKAIQKSVKAHLELLEDLFDGVSITYPQLKYLVLSLRGNISGDSHFDFTLPNTHQLWEETAYGFDLQRHNFRRYNACRPHGGKHNSEELTPLSLSLVKRAFKDAGITPKRLARAEEMDKEALVPEKPKVQRPH